MIAKLHYITQEIDNRSHIENAEEACKAGVKWVQLRVKNKAYAEWLQIAIHVQAICKKYKATFIINDNVTLAKEIRANGVHLGKTDINPVQAREILGPGYTIGATANTAEDILKLNFDTVDYIGLGPFRYTDTKDNLSPILGIEGYRNVIQAIKQNGVSIPVIAIGGIILEDVEQLMTTGIHGIAVASYINRSMDKKKIVDEFRQKKLL